MGDARRTGWTTLEDQDDIVARSMRGETAPRIEAATGWSRSTIFNVLRRLGARKIDRPEAIDNRRRPPAETISPDWRSPRGALTEKAWLALFARLHAGERMEDLCEEAGVTPGTVRRQAARRGQRGCDVPGSLAVRGGWRAAMRVRAVDVDLTRPDEAAALLTAQAEAALRDGRTADARDAMRTVKMLEGAGRRSGRVRGGAPIEPDEPPLPPLALHPAQRPPSGDWSTWVFMGGRGAGKTFAGAAWLHARAIEARGQRLLLMGPSLHDVREVMFGGPSGLVNVARHRDERPRWEQSRRRAVWPNETIAEARTAEDADGLRGPQYHHGWADEFCVWKRAGETLATLRMGLRLGERPRLVVTTTPKPLAALRALLAEDGAARTDAPTSANAAHLPPGWVEQLQARYGGTRLSAQELDGLLLEAEEGALWRRDELMRCRSARPDRFERVVVAVDPPAGAMSGEPTARAACGIVAAGVREGRFYVLGDWSVKGLGPTGWAEAAAQAARETGASAVVAEANQGGEMVRSTLVNAGVTAKVSLRHARVGKRARAEPIAALYEQGRVSHCAVMEALEEEMCSLGAEGAEASTFDRVDALVWALTELSERAATGPRVGWG